MLAISFNIVKAVIHKNVSALTYSITAEFAVTAILIIVTAALFALSVIKFKSTCRLEKIIMCTLIAILLIAVIIFFGFYEIMYIAIFVCTAYTIDLILS